MGRVFVGIAYCPQCGRDVYLDEARREYESISDELQLAVSYTAVHRGPAWSCTHGREHSWVAERIELRRVFAMELEAT